MTITNLLFLLIYLLYMQLGFLRRYDTLPRVLIAVMLYWHTHI